MSHERVTDEELAGALAMAPDAVPTATWAAGMMLKFARTLRDERSEVAALREKARAVDAARGGLTVHEDLADAIEDLMAEVDGAPVERTPKIVLRAMLRAYEARAESANVEMMKAGAPADKVELRRLVRPASVASCDAEDVRIMLYHHLAGLDCGAAPHILADYKARLRGDRPLDALPLELHEVPTCSL